MSISASYSTWGLLGWLARIFSPKKDGRSLAMIRTLHIINKVLEEIEITRKRMEERYSDLAKKAKEAATKGDKDHHEILLVEMDEVSKLIALMEHAKKSVFQIRLRLETMLEMGNTFDQLPEIMSVISDLKPILARITPELMERMTELEKEVSSIMASTSIPPVYGRAKPKELDSISSELRNELKDLLPPHNESSKCTLNNNVVMMEVPRRRSNVDINIVKKWLLDEIRSSNGFLDIESFTRKYGVDKKTVLETLNKLYEEGKIVFKQ